VGEEKKMRFNEFEKQNCPAQRSVSWGTLIESLKKVGSQMVSIGLGEEKIVIQDTYPVSQSGCYVEVRKSDIVFFNYVPGVVDPGTCQIVYVPSHIQGAVHKSGKKGVDLFAPYTDAILKLLTTVLGEVKVPLPEPVVVLPVPGYVSHWVVGDWTANSSDAGCPEMFVSEAREALENYMTAAKAVVDQAAK
jgi:hypothetical protein